MADLMGKLGWIAWCLTIIGWFLSPIISLLVDKIFVYLVFDTSKKLKELENDIIRKLKQMLSTVEEQTVLRAAEDKGSQSDLKILDSMKMDLKSALYEAEDILDLLDYRRIEKDIHLGDDDSRWVENQLNAASAWIAHCKKSSFGRWIDLIQAGLMKGAQSLSRLWQFIIQGSRHSRQNFDLFCIRRDINIAGAAVVQCTQSWYQQLGQLFRRVILGRSHRSNVLLPVSINPTPQPPCLESRGSVFVPADSTRRPAEEMVDEEEIVVEETQAKEREAEEIQGVEGEMSKEIEEGCEGGQEEEIEEESTEGEVGQTSSEEETEEDDEEGKEGEMSKEIEEGCEGGQEDEIEEESTEGEVGDMSSEEEIEEENTEGEVGEMSSEEEIEEESTEGEVGETSSEEEIEEDDEEGKEGEPTSLSILRYCARSMLTWFAKACFYRDWSYGIVGIKSDKKDASAVESLVPITERISLKNRIKRIEDILNISEKSDLLNDKNSGSGTTKDTGKESISFTAKNSAKERSSEQKEIAELSRDIGREVFGRDKDRADISRMLREGPDTYAASSSTSKPYSVIGIYGITGSGKSTLAQYVCDYEKGAGHFKPVMFIHVGKTFSVYDIFRDMMEQITQSRPANDEGLKSLKTKLEKTLKDKCFLLVLDDLWVNDDNQNGMDILLDTLSAAQSGSRVLVTAQKADAAGALGTHLQPFSIPDLEEEVYLSLLMHNAGPFPTDDNYRKYERIGRKIANRLHRSPIAAVTVGKQLQRNKSISFWETTANLEMLNKTMGALWWSYQQLGVDIRRCFTYCSIFPKGYRFRRDEYQQLGVDIRRCFTYCSIFPKGYRFRRDELVHIWIAQGFVNTRGNATEELEDVGQRYFDKLLTFSFVQEKGTLMYKAFAIHDLLHELAERVSGNEFFKIGFNGSSENIPQGVRHVFIETNNGAEMAEKIVGLKNLRTLIINEDPYTEAPEKTIYQPYYPEPPEETIKRNRDGIEKVLGRLFMSLTKLRVLIFKRTNRKKQLSVPASIDHMKHLRYLGFRFHDERLSKLILPSTFSKLYHMQTIDIPCLFTSGPQDMANLIYLRYISDLSFPNIGRLTSLQSHSRFIVKEEQGYGLMQLKHLNKLRGSLCIYGLDIVGGKQEALEAHLTHKERLRELEFYFGGWDSQKRRFGPDVEAEVLEGLCPPKDLEGLHIWHYWGSRYPSWMSTRHHPDAPKQLHKLSLCHCSSQLASIPEDSKLFIGLHGLQIHCCDWLPQNMECLVSLQTLSICGCHKVKRLPTLPHQSLKRISIVWCKVLSKTCKEEGHENWHKIQHIPGKTVY